MKKLCSLILCIGLLCMLGVPASASTGKERSLQYDHIDTVTANITLDSFWGIVSCDGSIEATRDNRVYVEVALQQKTDSGWTTLKTWTNEDQNFVEASGRYAVPKGYQYRTYTTGYVYDDAGNIIDSATAVYAIEYS